MVTVEEQRIQAIKDEQARQRSRDRFLAGEGTPEELRVISLFGAIRQSPNQVNNPRKAQEIRNLIAGGNVNLKRVPNFNQSVLDRFPAPTQQTTTKLTESMKDEPVTITEESALVKAQRVKNMTLPASEIISIRGVN